MKNCSKCNSVGRVKQVVQSAQGDCAQYICANPRCPNFKQVFAKELLAKMGAENEHAKKQSGDGL